MMVDKEKLNALLAMSDGDLWREVRKIADSHGFTLPESAPPPSEMQKLRGAVSGSSSLNLGKAVKIINDYRRSVGK